MGFDVDSGIGVFRSGSHNERANLYWDAAVDRWAVSMVSAENPDAITGNFSIGGKTNYIATVTSSAGKSGQHPTQSMGSDNPMEYGSSTPSRVGQMYVDEETGDIWIWS